MVAACAVLCAPARSYLCALVRLWTWTRGGRSVALLCAEGGCGEVRETDGVCTVRMQSECAMLWLRGSGDCAERTREER